MATLDSAGRVLIPKALREEIGLEAGDTLSVESDGEGVTLRPVRSGAAMRKENGIWVFRTGQQISAAETDQALEKLRASRDRRIGGR